MSERWKYQIKIGGFWGLFMVLFMLLFEWKEKPIAATVTEPKFYVRLVVYLLGGIFIVGYFFWKGRKNEVK